jgi:transcription initiation factor TFIIE subunit beta
MSEPLSPIFLQTRQAFTAEQINDATHVDVAGNKDIFERLKKNPRVFIDGDLFSYKVNSLNIAFC